jgi:hypothetical protein
MHEFMHIVTDPSHWAFEALSDAVFAGVGALVGRFWLRRHDRKHHAAPVSVEFVQEMFRVQSALIDYKIDRLSKKIG